MKIRNVITALCLILIAAALPAAAKNSKYDNTISMNYWPADYKRSTEGLSESSGPHFFPELTALILFEPRLSIDMRYQSSNPDPVTPGGNGEEDKVTRYLLGVVYDFPSGIYAGLAYQEIKNRTSDDSGGSVYYKLNGARFSLGRRLDLRAPRWSVDGEIAIGVGCDAKVSGAAGYAPPERGSEWDFDLRFIYDLNRAGMAAHAGYRYIKFKSDTIRTSPPTAAITHTIRGPYFGLSYNF